MKLSVLISILLSLSVVVSAQNGPASKRTNPEFENEALVIHQNSDFFLTGETLLFEVYCFNQEPSPELSTKSKLAYFELIGENKQVLAQIKVQLVNGVGNGEFYFPGNTPSGHYNLVGYTRWMRNFDPSEFFRRTITVINPDVKPPLSDSLSDSVSSRGGQNVEALSRLPDGIAINLNKKEFNTRGKVSLDIASDQKSLILSVNVRTLEKEFQLTSPWDHVSKNQVPSSFKRIQFLPDFRSELITGTITAKSNGRPASGKLVTLSGPAANFEFLVSLTDSSGRYYFNSRDIRSDYVLFGVLDPSPGEFEIHWEENFLQEYDQFVPSKFHLDATLKTLIEKKYLSLQVENAFYEVKKDSILGTQKVPRFFGTPTRSYNLDDFTRFTSMEDVFREIIPEVVVKIRDGKYSLLMMNTTSGYRLANPPLVLVDGVPVADANTVMKYDPSLIRTINLVTQRYYYGELETDGIISIETYTGTAQNLNTDHLISVRHIPPSPKKLYKTPDYEKNAGLKRIPDFRSQLYWNPSIIINSGTSHTLSFFTGDLAGNYAIEIAGVSSKGERIYWREIITVKE